MRTKSSVLAYVIAAIAVVASVFLYVQNRNLEARLEALPDGGIDNVRETYIRPPDAREDVVEEVNELSAQLSDANTQIASLKEQLDNLRTDGSAEAKEDSVPGDQTPADTPADEEEPRTLDEMRARLTDNAAVSAQVKALTEMAYADFFGAVELDADTKNAVRQAFVESQLEQAALAQYAIQEGATGREYGEWKREERERLNEQMRAVLSPDDHAVWEGYEETLDQRMLEATFENQFNAFASGLTPENHELAMTVAVEEFLEEQWALENSEDPFTQADNFQFQLDAMASMRERLQPIMEEDQYRELENWLNMGENVMRQGLNSVEEAQNTAN